eukprot:gene2402-2706_t
MQSIDSQPNTQATPWPSMQCQLPAAALAALQACTAVLAGHLAVADPSWAVLNSPNARIPRTVDAALRRSIPAFNTEVAAIQKTLEDIAYLLRIPQRKPWGNMAADVATAIAAFDDRVYHSSFSGICTDPLISCVQAPGLPFSIPKEYSNRPRLVGRATVELTVEKGDGSLAFVDTVNGGLSSTGKVYLTLDGYSAPVSAGNFLINVLDGLYNNKQVQASYASVITPGDAVSPRPPIPLENLPAGTFDPLYRFPLDVQSGELPVLPLSIAGAVSMTHLPETESFLSGDEWFIFKFDKQQAGLSGLSFDEGTFGVFGYVTDGMDVVGKLQTGDIISKAEVTSGIDRLVRPSPPGV